jgi:hypothetical protein
LALGPGARDLPGHAIRGEFDQFGDVVEAIGEQSFLEAGSLCLRIAGYVAIDACAWQWPTDADVREIAQAISALDNEFDLTEQDAHDYLSRAVLRFEPFLDVFPDPESRNDPVLRHGGAAHRLPARRPSLVGVPRRDREGPRGRCPAAGAILQPR